MPIRLAATLAGIAFVVLLSASLFALRGIRRGGRGWHWPGLALLSGLLSAAGVSGRTPFGSVPEVAYVWSQGSLEIGVRSGWCFLLPLALAAAGIVLYFRRPTPGQPGS